MEEVNVTPESKMKKHVTIVGVIHIAFGVLGLIGALTVFFALNFARGFVSNDEIPTMVLSILSLSLPLLIGFMSTLGLIGGIGLMAYKNWGRYLVIIVAALGCINIPIGTLKGVYSLWVLLQDDTIKLFEKQ
jgi:O-antigen/teichoic acid export membrane protein